MGACVPGYARSGQKSVMIKVYRVEVRGSGGSKGLKVTKGPTNIFGKFPGEKSGGVV